MKQIASLLGGAALGFSAALLTIAAAVFMLTGLAGGLLVRVRPGTASVINFDPREVVILAGYTGIAALGVWLAGLVIFRRSRGRTTARRC